MPEAGGTSEIAESALPVDGEFAVGWRAQNSQVCAALGVARDLPSVRRKSGRIAALDDHFRRLAKCETPCARRSHRDPAGLVVHAAVGTVAGSKARARVNAASLRRGRSAGSKASSAQRWRAAWSQLLPWFPGTSGWTVSRCAARCGSSSWPTGGEVNRCR
jgi:hypothetical protein